MLLDKTIVGYVQFGISITNNVDDQINNHITNEEFASEMLFDVISVIPIPGAASLSAGSEFVYDWTKDIYFNLLSRLNNINWWGE